MKSKNVFVIAGPNGAGKSTFAKEFLPTYVHCPSFINTDVIAQGLSFSPEQAGLKAGRIVLAQIDDHAAQGKDFGFETTLSGKTYVRTFEKLRNDGYQIHLFFLWLPTVQLALARVKERVLNGGHNVPEKDVRRRFERSIHNFKRIYKDLVDGWMFFESSQGEPRLIASYANGKLTIVDAPKYRNFLR